MFPFTRTSEKTAQRLAFIFFFTTLGLGLWLAATWLYIRHLTLVLPMPEVPKPVVYQPAPIEKVSPLLLQYRLDLPGRGEVFPAMQAAAASDYWPISILTISNAAERPVLQVVSAEIPGWSRPFQQSIVIGPQQTLGLKISPELLPKANNVAEIEHATLKLQVTDESGATMFAQQRPVLIHSGSDLYWGKQFANAQVVARWVTPHDSAVLQLVADARRFVPKGRLPGYNANGQSESSVAKQVTRQADAIFKALQRSGFSYVSSIYTFGGFTDVAQRIRLPRETLTLSTANCMDVSVAFASAIENVGMKPVIVILPGHAFTGVRLGADSSAILYLDLTVLPGGSFRQAQARAQEWLKKTPPEQVLTADIASARRMGLYPLASSPSNESVPAGRDVAGRDAPKSSEARSR
ncbi:MAG TPA: hypothetical protein VN622_02985 [Clostridia bacterium]|nr:hypothetical protein [Clostridia bacterium]